MHNEHDSARRETKRATDSPHMQGVNSKEKGGLGLLLKPIWLGILLLGVFLPLDVAFALLVFIAGAAYLVRRSFGPWSSVQE